MIDVSIDPRRGQFDAEYYDFGTHITICIGLNQKGYKDRQLFGFVERSIQKIKDKRKPVYVGVKAGLNSLYRVLRFTEAFNIRFKNKHRYMKNFKHINLIVTHF